jgi:hypothetical protein
MSRDSDVGSNTAATCEGGAVAICVGILLAQSSMMRGYRIKQQGQSAFQRGFWVRVCPSVDFSHGDMTADELTRIGSRWRTPRRGASREID